MQNKMKRAVYRVVVPYQEDPWCYHDNTYSKMGRYYDYCKLFTEEYGDIKPFRYIATSDMKKEFDKLREESRAQMIKLVNEGRRDELISLFSDEGSRGYLHLRELEIIAAIEVAEYICSFWQETDSFDTLRGKIAEVRFAAKRRFFGADDGTALSALENKYSREAIAVITAYYP
jgi:hypothetical protein